MTAPVAEDGPVLTAEGAAAYLGISRGPAFAAAHDGSLGWCGSAGGSSSPSGSSRRCWTALCRRPDRSGHQSREEGCQRRGAAGAHQPADAGAAGAPCVPHPEMRAEKRPRTSLGALRRLGEVARRRVSHGQGRDGRRRATETSRSARTWSGPKSPDAASAKRTRWPDVTTSTWPCCCRMVRLARSTTAVTGLTSSPKPAVPLRGRLVGWAWICDLIAPGARPDAASLAWHGVGPSVPTPLFPLTGRCSTPRWRSGQPEVLPRARTGQNRTPERAQAPITVARARGRHWIPRQWHLAQCLALGRPQRRLARHPHHRDEEAAGQTGDLSPRDVLRLARSMLHRVASHRHRRAWRSAQGRTRLARPAKERRRLVDRTLPSASGRAQSSRRNPTLSVTWKASTTPSET